jgi:hydroxymethylbilane synthase
MTDDLRIGTRGSKLALWQARWVQSAIEDRLPDVSAELVIIKTKGDKILDVPLANVGGKGLFVKEIEEALLAGHIDLAVHSMKDMPADMPTGLITGAVPQRENPLDVLISKHHASLETLPSGALIGTSSLRRSTQIKYLRPDIRIEPLRGNLETRLEKLETGVVDAIVLAAAGIHRLGMTDRISTYLPEEIMLPAVGQGALCIQTRKDDPRIAPLAASLNHPDTWTVVMAERAFLQRLEGGCQVPIAAHGRLHNHTLTLTGLVADLDGRHIIRSTIDGHERHAARLGQRLAEELLARGADKILERLHRDVH